MITLLTIIGIFFYLYTMEVQIWTTFYNLYILTIYNNSNYIFYNSKTFVRT